MHEIKPPARRFPLGFWNAVQHNGGTCMLHHFQPVGGFQSASDSTRQGPFLASRILWNACQSKMLCGIRGSKRYPQVVQLATLPWRPVCPADRLESNCITEDCLAQQMRGNSTTMLSCKKPPCNLATMPLEQHQAWYIKILSKVGYLWLKLYKFWARILHESSAKVTFWWNVEKIPAKWWADLIPVSLCCIL